VSQLEATCGVPAVRTLHGGVPWWRPTCKQPSTSTGSRARATASGSSLAFVALVSFTVILLLSPQAWFPALKVIRIAFLAAGLAMAAHVVERTIHRQAITPLSPEIGIALVLVCWSVLTIPLSYWPGGSVRVLVDHYLKAIAFFWLLGTIVTSTDRLRVLAWTLVLCSIPLAATGISNYLSGGQLSTGVRGFTRIQGYMGGSGLTSNPNDLALMLNLIIPIAGVLVCITRGVNRIVAASALLLSMAAVILTFSRAGFLTLAAVFVMFLAVLVRRKAPGAAVGLLLLAVCVPPLLPDGYMARLNTITHIQEDRTGSAQGRWKDTKIAVGVVAKNPIIGVGIGQDVLAMNDERSRDTWRRVHNAYLQYGVDLGIPGMLLFVWLNVLCFRTARAVEKRAAGSPAHRDLAFLAAGVQVSLVAFAVAAMFHPIAYQFYFFSIAGLAVALRNTWHTETGVTPLARSAS
jgi:probable O-glycosylation ligase (exosortase A-associated)